MSEPMLVPIFFLLPILLILTLIGSLLVLHLRKTEGIEFYSPWIGAAVIVNIAVLMNFSKIPLSKNIFELPYFNGITFMIIVLLFISILTFLFIKKHDFGFRRKNIPMYFFYIVCIWIFTAVFFNRLGDSVLSERGRNLQELSLAEGMIFSKQIVTNQFIVGMPILISLFAKFFNVSPLTISKLIHGLFAVLDVSLISLLILKIVRPSGKNIYFYVSLAVFIALFFIFPIRNIPLNIIIMTGLFALIASLTIDYIKILETQQHSFFNMDEVVLALMFLFLAVINAGAFKLGVALFLIVIGLRLLTRKNQLSYGWLRVILIMILLNPLLIGFSLRY